MQQRRLLSGNSGDKQPPSRLAPFHELASAATRGSRPLAAREQGARCILYVVSAARASSRWSTYAKQRTLMKGALGQAADLTGETVRVQPAGQQRVWWRRRARSVWCECRAQRTVNGSALTHATFSDDQHTRPKAPRRPNGHVDQQQRTPQTTTTQSYSSQRLSLAKSAPCRT